jgi:hypothetical protein
MRRSTSHARDAHAMWARSACPALARAARAFLAAMLLVATACGEGFSPTVDTVAGAYTATQLTLIQQPGVGPGHRTFDLLADGGSLALTLQSQGTVAGRIFVPNPDGDVDLSLTGTWGLAGNRVTLHLNAGTFLDNLELTASEIQLVGVYTSEVAVVHVRLQKPTSND